MTTVLVPGAQRERRGDDHRASAACAPSWSATSAPLSMHLHASPRPCPTSPPPLRRWTPRRTLARSSGIAHADRERHRRARTRPSGPPAAARPSASVAVTTTRVLALAQLERHVQRRRARARRLLVAARDLWPLRLTDHAGSRPRPAETIPAMRDRLVVDLRAMRRRRQRDRERRAARAAAVVAAGAGAVIGAARGLGDRRGGCGRRGRRRLGAARRWTMRDSWRRSPGLVDRR